MRYEAAYARQSVEKKNVTAQNPGNTWEKWKTFSAKQRFLRADVVDKLN